VVPGLFAAGVAGLEVVWALITAVLATINRIKTVFFIAQSSSMVLHGSVSGAPAMEHYPMAFPATTP
jgi:hypothetical protein